MADRLMKMTSNLLLCVWMVLCTLLFGTATAQSPANAAATSARDLDRQFIEALQARVLGDLEESAVLFEQILERNPENAAAAYELARIFEAQDQPEKAMVQAQRAVDLNPDNSWYQTLLAQTLESADRPLDAAEIYETLHRQEPDNDYYLMMKAYLLVVGQQPEQAIRVYDDLERRVGVVPEISNKKIRLYVGLGKEDKAAKALRSLVDAYPSHVEYRHELAELYAGFGDREEALKVYREILSVDPSDPKARLAVNGGPTVPENTHPFEQLSIIFADADVPIDLKIKQILPLVEQAANSPGPEGANRLLPLCEVIRDAHPKEAKAHALYADVLGLAGNTEAAVVAYREALKYDKSVFAVWEQLMLMLLGQNDFKELQSVSEESLDLFPNQALSYYLNGLAALRMEDFQNAVSSLQQASFMTSGMPALSLDVLNSLGEALYKNGQPERGAAAFEKALDTAPTAVAILANYAVQLIEAGQAKRAQESIQKAKDADSNHPGVSVAQGLLALRISNDPETAQKFLLQALEQGVRDPLLLEWLGEAALQLDDQERAVTYWKEALQLGGNTERLNARIQTSANSR